MGNSPTDGQVKKEDSYDNPLDDLGHCDLFAIKEWKWSHIQFAKLIKEKSTEALTFEALSIRRL